MPNELYPDSDPLPSPRVEAWLRSRIQREFPGLPEQAIACAIRNAAALMHPRRRRGVILSAARICLFRDAADFAVADESPSAVDASLAALLRGCLPAVVEPPDAERFNREIFAKLWAGGEGRC